MSGGDWKALFAAACEGDVELVRFYAGQGIDVDYAHPEFQDTALVACLMKGQEEAAHALLDLGASPDLRSEFEEMTPLEAARAMRLTSVVARLGG